MSWDFGWEMRVFAYAELVYVFLLVLGLGKGN